MPYYEYVAKVIGLPVNLGGPNNPIWIYPWWPWLPLFPWWLDPICLTTGNNRLDASDLEIPCPLIPLELRRSYNSVMLTAEPLGYGWHHGYDWQAGVVTNMTSVPLSAGEWGRDGGMPSSAVTVVETCLVVQAVCDLSGGLYSGGILCFSKQADGTYKPASQQYNGYEARGVAGGGYEVVAPGGLVYAFGANGSLQRITHPAGPQVTLDYGVTGGVSRLVKVRHSNGQYLDFQYAGGKLVRVNTPDPGVYVEYAQDTTGDLVGVTRHDGGRSYTSGYSYVREGYRSRHWLKSRTNSRGEVIDYEYASSSGPTALAVMNRGPAGVYEAWIDYVSDTFTRLRVQRDGEELATDYTFNSVTKLPMTIVGPNNTNRVETFRYDGQLCPVEHRYSEGGDYLVTRTAYDTNRNPVATDVGYNRPAGTNVALGWNADKTLSWVKDALGAGMGVDYTNALPRAVREECPTGTVSRTVLTYLPGGLVSSVTNANGNVVTFRYESRGYVTNMAAGTSLWAGVQYDVLGYATNITVPGGNGPRSTGLKVNGQGRPLQVTYPNGQVENFAYDGFGLLTNHVDVAGRVSRYAYRVGELVKAERVFGTGDVERIEVGYDQQMNTRVVKDPLGREVERYVLDAADRVVAVTNLEGQSLSVTYGVLDMVKSLKRFDGTEVAFGYDGWGRLTNAAYPGGSVNFGYLSNGLPSFAANEAGVVSNAFDTANRLVGVEQCAPGGSLSYAYYPAGNVARVESVAGVSTYTNDNLERVSVISSAVGQFTFGYNAWNGLVDEVRYPNGMTAQYGYDEMDRATNIVFRDGQGNLVRSQELGYDAAGMITTNRLSDGSGLVEDRRYGYDGLDRLSGETVLDATGGVMRSASWSYDLAGNRLGRTADGSNTTYTYTQANRLTSWTGGSAAFDAAGCVTNLQYQDGRALSLTWNSRYQLTAVATNGVVAETYGHDALGRRVWTASAGVTNWHVYDGAQVVADVDAAGNMVRSYVWGPASTGSGQAGIDNLLSMTTYGEATNTYYAIKDHLGSVLALVDGNGAVAESYRYDAWGRVLSVKDGSGSALSCSALGARYLWQGREYSWATGLYNFRARWYDSIIGRWLSNDPIGISGGLNQYVFVDNNPVNFTDPLGLDVTVIGVSGNFVAVMGADVTFGVAISDNGWGIVLSAGADVGIGFGAGGTYQRYGGNCVNDIAGPYSGWTLGAGPLSAGRAYGPDGKPIGGFGDYQKGVPSSLARLLGNWLARLVNISAYGTLEGTTQILWQSKPKTTTPKPKCE
jgi:RHS repeat-associated protein